MSRRAFITGITGQDGSYLAEILLEQGYEVHGMVRRSSTEKFDRIEHLRDRIELHQGDLLDHRSLTDALRQARPDEIYNLAAMSFVAVSWIQPTLTAEFTGVGVTRLLEAMREVCPEARFYQASSSEMFGKVQEVPQTEDTPFYPRSPYGVAKAYDLHETSGILFNHECVAGNTPLVVRENGLVRVVTPADLVALRRKGPSVQGFEPSGVEVWDGRDWTEIRAITATSRRATDPDHALLSIQTRGGVVAATAHHTMLDADHEPLRADSVEEGDRLALAEEVPDALPWTTIDKHLGELLGLLAADGYVGDSRIQFTNNDPALQLRVAELWSRCFMGTSRSWTGSSGFDADAEVGQLALTGAPQVASWLREQLYTRTGHKQVPPLVLNGDPDAQDAFLEGYYAGDGLKRGSGASIKTNSAVLAQGVLWLYARANRRSSVYVEQRAGKTYYQLNVASPVRVGAKGQHLRRDPAEVRRIEPAQVPDDEWVFDLETASEKFCAGVGGLVVHNSPRRGLEFVTRKITWHAAAIKHGQIDKLRLGNLDAKRDWGYAKDYVKAMWLMLQQDKAEDFVIATGETHTVRECVEIAFDQAGLPDWEQYVELDPQFLRPAEVDLLIGSPAKAERVLGWKPETSFEELIRLMTDADLELLSR